MIRDNKEIENKQLIITFNALKVAHEYLKNNKIKMENSLGTKIGYDLNVDDMSVTFYLEQPCKCCRVLPGVTVNQVTDSTYTEIIERLKKIQDCREAALKHKIVLQMEYDKYGDMIFNEDLINKNEPVTNIVANFIQQFK